MSNKKKENKLKFSNIKNASFTNLIFSILIIYILICMISQPAKFITQSLNGISAWAYNVLPSVLPFMFFTKLLSNLDSISKLTIPFSRLSYKMFKTPPISMYTFLMAILSGYPVGSKMIADLYLQRKISQEDAFKMSSFCSTSGPMFIIGAVGIGMFKNSKIGYILFISHIIGAILNGITFRKLKLKTIVQSTSVKKESPSFNLADIILNSTLSILSVGTIITIFFITIECFAPIFNLFPKTISFFLEGIIEITRGCLDISNLTNLSVATTLSSFVISFGGISTILQSLTMLANVKMPIKLFIFQKFTHACFSTIITLLLIILFGV